MFDPFDAVVCSRLGDRAVEIACQGVSQNIADQGRLPRPADARHADEQADRDFDIDPPQIVLTRPDDLELAIARSPAFGGDRDRLAPGEILPGEALRVVGKSCEIAARNDDSALHARPRSEIDEVVRSAHRIFVVLDDDHRVADVPQAFESRDQLVVVPRVEADRWLIQNIEDADQTSPHLRRQPDALGFSSGECRRGAFEAEILKADIRQEPETPANLLQEFIRNESRCCVQRFGAIVA